VRAHGAQGPLSHLAFIGRATFVLADSVVGTVDRELVALDALEVRAFHIECFAVNLFNMKRFCLIEVATSMSWLLLISIILIVFSMRWLLLISIILIVYLASVVSFLFPSSVVLNLLIFPVSIVSSVVVVFLLVVAWSVVVVTLVSVVVADLGILIFCVVLVFS
jgi:hypothetical protein